MPTARLLGAACLLALAPSLARAQRGIGNMGTGLGRRGPGSLAQAPGLSIPKLVNGVNLLIEHRQDLALSDSQFFHIVAIKRALDSTNAPLARKLDSLQRLFKGGPIFSDPAPSRRDSLAEAHAVVVDAGGEIRDNISAARERAFALLSPGQAAKAQAFESASEQAIEAENSRGDRGRRGGGRPPE